MEAMNFSVRSQGHTFFLVPWRLYKIPDFLLSLDASRQLSRRSFHVKSVQNFVGGVRGGGNDPLQLTDRRNNDVPTASVVA